MVDFHVTFGKSMQEKAKQDVLLSGTEISGETRALLQDVMQNLFDKSQSKSRLGRF
jgi:hypothetical protein